MEKIYRKYLFCISLICTFLFISCRNRDNQEFTVFYDDHYLFIEWCAQPSCDSYEYWCSKCNYNDTIEIESETVEKIRDAIANAKPPVGHIDTIFAGPMLYMKFKDLDFCLSEIDSLCWIKGDDEKYHIYSFSQEASYLIKRKTGYYNHYKREELLDEYVIKRDGGLRQFGIPSDYKEINQDTIVDTEVKILMKVR